MMNSDSNWIQKACGEVERIEACFNGFAYAAHSHDTYTLAITTQGVQSFNYRGSLRHSLPGEVVILHPEEVHDGQAGTDIPFAYRAITINPIDVQNILQGYSLPFLEGGITNHPELVSIAKRFLMELNHPLDTMEHQELIFDFATCLHKSTSNMKKHTTANYFAIKNIREYIDDITATDNFADHIITLDELASISNYSKWQIIRDFKSIYGTTPYRYVSLKQLKKAKKLIEHGQPLSQVAVDCRFSDQSHMNRQFKKCFGTTPKIWSRLNLTQKYC